MRTFTSLLLSALMVILAVQDVGATRSAFSKKHGALKRAADLVPAARRIQNNRRTCARSHRPAPARTTTSVAEPTSTFIELSTSTSIAVVSTVSKTTSKEPAPPPPSPTPQPSPSPQKSEEPAPPPTTTKAAAPTQTASTPPPSSGGNNGGGSTSSSDIDAYLSGHNTLRAAHGASAMTWDDSLASAAQTWADKCVFKHSGGSLGPYGENLAAGTGAFSIAQGLNAWATEPYVEGQPSHFTQMVWKASTKVGCAVQTCTGIFGDTPTQFYVCEYSPQGNVIGNFDANVQA